METTGLPQNLSEGYRAHENARSPRFINVFEMGALDRADLKGRVEAANGELDILVHPYYKIWESVKNLAYPAGRRSLITDVTTGLSPRPLLILEEYFRFEDLAARLNVTQGSFFVMPTRRGDPRPVVNDSRGQTHCETFEHVTTLLNELGVKHAIISGKYMFLRKPPEHPLTARWLNRKRTLERLREVAEDKPNAQLWIDAGILPDGCAGFTATELLKDGFDVSLSQVSEPDVFMPENTVALLPQKSSA